MSIEYTEPTPSFQELYEHCEPEFDITIVEASISDNELEVREAAISFCDSVDLEDFCKSTGSITKTPL